MGLFFEHRQPTQPALQQAIREALASPTPDPDNLDAEAEDRANAIVGPAARTFQADRFIGAILIFASIIVAAIVAEANGWTNSSEALFGFGTTVLGVIVGFLGGESAVGQS